MMRFEQYGFLFPQLPLIESASITAVLGSTPTKSTISVIELYGIKTGLFWVVVGQAVHSIKTAIISFYAIDHFGIYKFFSIMQET